MIQAIFSINQKRIARTLCVEKDIEDSKCGGCCQLKKTLAEENADEGTIPAEQKQSEMVIALLDENEFSKLPKYINERDQIWPIETSAICIGFLSSIFYPPDVA